MENELQTAVNYVLGKENLFYVVLLYPFKGKYTPDIYYNGMDIKLVTELGNTSLQEKLYHERQTVVNVYIMNIN